MKLTLETRIGEGPDVHFVPRGRAIEPREGLELMILALARSIELITVDRRAQWREHSEVRL